MVRIKINTQKNIGKIKPMHAANNGPVGGNFEAYKALEIPWVRNHDAAHCHSYGGERTVDINAIFPDFSKDPTDPEAYDFCCTDEYLRTIQAAGSKVFYRLGNKIDHRVKKYDALPPADYHKWAVICEHIIKHYNEGWNEGFHWNIEYWEIWNEPDNVPACWIGPLETYYELYEIAASHLKEKFPNIRIGGPAFAEWSVDNGSVRAFVEYVSQRKVPLDFLSWHTYSKEIGDFTRRAQIVREVLDEFGYTETESILNEWNYLVSWQDLVGTFKKIHGMEGAAMVSAMMAVGQNSSIDMLMYYDIRPTAFNGLFDMYTNECLKGYYPFLWFSKLYKAGNQLEAASDDEDVYVVAASDGGKSVIMVTYYSYDETSEEKTIDLNLEQGVSGQWELRMLDENRDAETIMEMEADIKSLKIVMKPNAVLLLECK